MDDHFSEGFGKIPNLAETFGSLPRDAEPFGNVPQPSASFGIVPHLSESFGTLPKFSERTDHHTLTVREVARRFEEAGVPRTERSITNWCQPNAQGMSRLDAFLDTNERKYFITPESVSRAIEEERSKQQNAGVNASASASVPKRAEEPREAIPKHAEGRPESHDVEMKLRDLEITNRVKDQLIDQLKNQLEKFDDERQTYVQSLMSHSRQIGQLETHLRQIEAPSSEGRTAPPKGDLTFPNTSAAEVSSSQNFNSEIL